MKFLDVMLKPKFNSSLILELKIKKACIAFYDRKRTFHEEMGPPTKDVFLNADRLSGSIV